MNRTPPVVRDQVLDLTINDQGKKGDGLGYLDDFVIFVPNTTPGQHVRVRVVKVFASFAKAEVIEAI